MSGLALDFRKVRRSLCVSTGARVRRSLARCAHKILRRFSRIKHSRGKQEKSIWGDYILERNGWYSWTNYIAQNQYSSNQDNLSGAVRHVRNITSQPQRLSTDNSLRLTSIISFAVSSTDGFLRLWDKSKILLREISLDGSLAAASFLNNRGTVKLVLAISC